MDASIAPAQIIFSSTGRLGDLIEDMNRMLGDDAALNHIMKLEEETGENAVRAVPCGARSLLCAAVGGQWARAARH